MIKSFCIGHVAPLFTPSVEFTMLCPTSVGLSNEIVISDDRFGLDCDGGSLAEYSQLFGLYEMLKSGDLVADQLHLFQYRKYLSPKILKSAGHEHWISRIGPDVAALTFPDVEQLNIPMKHMVVGREFDMGMSMAKNYAKAHEIEDLIYFMTTCSDGSVLNASEIKEFSEMSKIIFSPALCIVNSGVFCKLMEIMTRVWRDYKKHFYIRREGYQRRVAGYLFERLHSYFIYKILGAGQIDSVFAWNRYLVSVD